MDYLCIISGSLEIIGRIFGRLFEIICGLFERFFLGYLRLFADYLSDTLLVFLLSPALICHDRESLFQIKLRWPPEEPDSGVRVGVRPVN